eukprot:274078-Amphidinium_carterae.1
MRRAPKGTWNTRPVNPGGDKLEVASGKLPTAAGSPQCGTQTPPVEGQRMHTAGKGEQGATLVSCSLAGPDQFSSKQRSTYDLTTLDCQHP